MVKKDVQDPAAQAVQVDHVVLVETSDNMSKEKVLLVYDDNWADEFNISAWQIIDKDKWESLRDQFLEKVGENNFCCCFGTNEEIDYDNASAFIDQIAERPISAEEFKTIKKVFGVTEMGAIDIIGKLQYGIEEYNFNDSDDMNMSDEEDEDF